MFLLLPKDLTIIFYSLENIFADCQHGFHSQRSCETQLVQFFHDMVSNLDRAQNRGHRQTDVIIMDFAKAFDKVPHKRFLYKLHYCTIRGSTHKWIASWLSALSKSDVRWPILRSSPGLIWSPARIGLGTGPFLDIY